MTRADQSAAVVGTGEDRLDRPWYVAVIVGAQPDGRAMRPDRVPR
jgi:hypothetical protein